MGALDTGFGATSAETVGKPIPEISPVDHGLRTKPMFKLIDKDTMSERSLLSVSPVGDKGVTIETIIDVPRKTWLPKVAPNTWGNEYFKLTIE